MTERSVRAGQLDPEIWSEIEGSSPERRRRIAVRAAREALMHQAEHIPDLEMALETLDETGLIDPQTATSVRRIAAELDDRYLHLHDDEKPEGRSDGWESAFRLARAAASVASALAPDPTEAAIDGSYEAWFATDEHTSLRDVLRATP